MTITRLYVEIKKIICVYFAILNHSRLMKYFLLLLFSFFSIGVSAQNFSGQWKGQFTDRSTSYMGWGGQTCEYVLELECKGSTVTGFSYTYFTEGGVRYYTICKLSGKMSQKEKYVEVTETERVKTNVPATVRNCFQVHKLYYSKSSDGSEMMEGKWNPAPEQSAGCGFGITSLSRRLLKTSYPGFNKDGSNSKLNKPIPAIVAKKPAVVKQPITRKKLETKSIVPNNDVHDVDKGNGQTKELPHQINEDADTKKKQVKILPIEFSGRNNAVLNTLYVVSNTVKVELYDSGEIDGDSVSLYFNNQLLASKKRLTDKPLQFTLDLTNNTDINELVMYAENLGTIPPNTALMVVTDGVNRYEVRITSDLTKSGTIRFIKKDK